MTLEISNHEILGEARRAHKQSLKDDYKQKYFITNGAMNIPAIGIVLLAKVVSLASGDGPTPSVIGAIVLMFVLMAFFAIIMKRPTLRGRQVLDDMLGFKDYLEIAEKEELNLRNPPEKTPQLFESLLPFALALGVDQQWSQRPERRRLQAGRVLRHMEFFKPRKNNQRIVERIEFGNHLFCFTAGFIIRRWRFLRRRRWWRWRWWLVKESTNEPKCL